MDAARVARVEIDLNNRVRGNWTVAGLEDADVPVRVGDDVEVFEPESGVVGTGRVEDIDSDKRLLYLSVDWSTLREGCGVCGLPRAAHRRIVNTLRCPIR